MSRGFPQRRPSRSPQIGDMRERIEIYRREMGVPDFGATSFTQNHELIFTLWASAESFAGNLTYTGDSVFDGVNLRGKIVYKFTIRHTTGLEASDIINYKGSNYKIEIIDPLELRQRFLFIYSTLLGIDSLKVNQ